MRFSLPLAVLLLPSVFSLTPRTPTQTLEKNSLEDRTGSHHPPGGGNPPPPPGGGNPPGNPPPGCSGPGPGGPPSNPPPPGGGSWPPACQADSPREKCFEWNWDCNEYCICVKWEKCCQATVQGCKSMGGWLDNDCNCHIPSGSSWGGGGHNGHNGHGHKRSQSCPSFEQTACKIDDSFKPKSRHAKPSYECIDTKNTLDSCGGCVSEGQGQDCTAIEGVDEVECLGGECKVMACERGWMVSEDGKSCVNATSIGWTEQGLAGFDAGKGFVKSALVGAEKFWGL